MTKSEAQFQRTIQEWLDCPIPNEKFKERFVRRALIYRRGEKCEYCGDSKVPMQLEHKDGDFTNNTPGNVCLLCGTCHSMTPTYAGRNRGRGRKTRRERDELLRTVIEWTAAKTRHQLEPEIPVLVHGQKDAQPQRIITLRPKR